MPPALFGFLLPGASKFGTGSPKPKAARSDEASAAGDDALPAACEMPVSPSAEAKKQGQQPQGILTPKTESATKQPKQRESSPHEKGVSVAPASVSPFASAREQRRQQGVLAPGIEVATNEANSAEIVARDKSRALAAPQNSRAQDDAVGKAGEESSRESFGVKRGGRPSKEEQDAEGGAGPAAGNGMAVGIGGSEGWASADAGIEEQSKFLKQLRGELMFMLENNGGRCKMVSAAGLYKTTFGRLFNLRGKKVSKM